MIKRKADLQKRSGEGKYDLTLPSGIEVKVIAAKVA